MTMTLISLITATYADLLRRPTLQPMLTKVPRARCYRGPQLKLGVPLPLFHAFAGMGVINTFLVIACTYVIPGYKFTVAETLSCMSE